MSKTPTTTGQLIAQLLDFEVHNILKGYHIPKEFVPKSESDKVGFIELATNTGIQFLNVALQDEDQYLSTETAQVIVKTARAQGVRKGMLVLADKEFGTTYPGGYEYLKNLFTILLTEQIEKEESNES